MYDHVYIYISLSPFISLSLYTYIYIYNYIRIESIYISLLNPIKSPWNTPAPWQLVASAGPNKGAGTAARPLCQRKHPPVFVQWLPWTSHGFDQTMRNLINHQDIKGQQARGSETRLQNNHTCNQIKYTKHKKNWKYSLKNQEFQVRVEKELKLVKIVGITCNLCDGRRVMAIVSKFRK